MSQVWAFRGGGLGQVLCMKSHMLIYKTLDEKIAVIIAFVAA